MTALRQISQLCHDFLDCFGRRINMFYVCTICLCVSIILHSSFGSPLQSTSTYSLRLRDLHTRTTSVRSSAKYLPRADLPLQILECDDESTHTYTDDPRVTAHFATMGQFCTAYPLGIGMYCREERGLVIVDITRPVSYVFTAFTQEAIQFSQICSQICVCENISPDEPEVHEPARASILGLTSDDEEGETLISTQATVATTHIPRRTDLVSNADTLGTTCDGRLYGRPLYTDCRAALRTFPDYSGEDRRLIREYLGVGVEPNWQPTLNDVQTPQILTSGRLSNKSVQL